MEETSICLSKLICKVTELENDLQRYRTISQTSSVDVHRLQQEKQHLQQLLNQSTNEKQGYEAALAKNADQLEQQESSHAQEVANLQSQLQLQKDARNKVLEQRNETQISLKMENYELQEELKRVKLEYEALLSQRSCQIQLSNALDSELKVLKNNTQAMRMDISKLDNLIKNCYARLQDSFVNGERLMNQVKAEKMRNHELEEKAQEKDQKCQQLERELERSKATILLLERQMQMLQRDLQTAQCRIQEEQDHKSRILELLKTSEEENAQLEQTIDSQCEQILSFQQSKSKLTSIQSSNPDEEKHITEMKSDESEKTDLSPKKAEESPTDSRVEIKEDGVSILNSLFV